MEVFSRRGNRGMAQGGLHQMDRGTPVRGMGCVGMAQPMGGHRGRNAGPFRRGPDDPFCFRRVEMPLPFATFKYPISGITLPL
jgi:hypothetical protein